MTSIKMESTNQIIFGKKPILEALRSDVVLEKIYLDRTMKGPFEMEVRKKAKELLVPISKVPTQRLSRWTKGNHQGVIALTSLVEYQPESKLIEGIAEGEISSVMVLDHITDVRNLGAIARSAYFFGIKNILLPLKGTAEVNKDAMKSSAGALAHMTCYRASNLSNTLLSMRDQECKIYALESKGGKNVNDFSIKNPWALVIGSEGHGVTKELLRLSHEKVHIVAQSNFDSLNVSVATGIALHTLTNSNS